MSFYDNTKIEKGFIIIIPILVLIYFYVQIIFSSGKLSPDSLQYLRQADDFWNYKINFPLGYPLIIKLFTFFSGSSFWASKMVNIFCYLGVLLFSYKKKFYFKETILLFSFYPLIQFYAFTWSESLFFFLLYLFIFLVNRIIIKGLTSSKIVFVAILIFAITSVRFSSVFITFPTMMTVLLNKNIYWQKRAKFSLISIFAVATYLLINYFYSGYLMGKREHLLIEPQNIIVFSKKVSLSFLRDFSFLNAFDHKFISSLPLGIHYFTTILFLLALLILCIRKLPMEKWVNYLLITAGCSFIGICLSYYKIRIDDSIRIKSAVYFFLLFAFLIISSKAFKLIAAYIVTIVLLCNIATYLYYSQSSLEQFALIKEQFNSSQKSPHIFLQSPPPLVQSHSSHRNPGKQNCH